MRLSEIVKTNYDKIIDEDVPAEISRFLRETTTMVDERLSFIKQITKIGHLIIQELDTDLVEKLIQFHHEGIK